MWMIRLAVVALALGLAWTVLEKGAAEAATPVACGDQLDVSGGHYVLSSDLSCPGDGVRITADGVQFDLSGFTLSGPKCGGADCGVGIAVGGHSCMSTSGVRVSDGTVTDFATGLWVSCAVDASITDITVSESRGPGGTGLIFENSSFSRIARSEFSRNNLSGAWFRNSHHNEFTGNVLALNFGNYPSSGGLALQSSDYNVISKNTVSNSAAGIALGDSSGNIVRGNSTANDLNIGLLGDSDGNRISHNVSEGGIYGIGVGCCGYLPHGIGFQPTNGADNNVVESNSVTGSEFGVAEYYGNENNVYKNNSAGQISIIGFYPPLPLPRLRGGLASADQQVIERYSACAEAWWDGQQVETQLSSWYYQYDQQLKARFEALKSIAESSCAGIGPALAALDKAGQSWCGYFADIVQPLRLAGPFQLFPGFFVDAARTEVEAFLSTAPC